MSSSGTSMAARGKQCIECGEPATEMHHIVPRSRGGAFMVPLCAVCHGKAHHMERNMDHSRLTREGIARAKGKLGNKMGAPIRITPQAVDRIMTLKSDGLSVAKIASRLNEEGVPTATGASWHPTTVQRQIAKRLKGGM